MCSQMTELHGRLDDCISLVEHHNLQNICCYLLDWGCEHAGWPVGQGKCIYGLIARDIGN